MNWSTIAKIPRLLGMAVIITVVSLAATVPGTTSATAQGQQIAACSQIVERALEITETHCEGTGRNQACYGHTNLVAHPQAEAEQFVFVEAGDTVKVDQMQSLRLGRMDESAGTWGIALLRLQASIPNSRPENVTVVLFGDVAIEDATPDLPTLYAQPDTSMNVNVRSAPSVDGIALGTLAPNDVTLANGRSADSAWLRITLPDTGTNGWAFADLLAVDGDLSELKAVTAAEPVYGPMQAFTLQTGIDDAPCVEAPQSGLIIQTPEGMGKITFLINEIDIQLGSTVFFQAEAGNRMDVSVVEGSATVSADGVTQYVPAGMALSVPLSAEGAPAGPPQNPRPYDMSDVAALPTLLLPRAVTVAEPFTPPAVVDVPDTGDEDGESPTGEVPDGGSSSSPTDPLDGGTENPPPAEQPCKPRPPGHKGDDKGGEKFCD